MHDENHVARLVGTDDTSEVIAVDVDAALESLVSRLLRRHEVQPPSRTEMVSAGLQKMDVKAAASRIAQKLPGDVASLVRVSVGDEHHQPFAESSLAKARKYLNAMTVKAWKELDEQLIGCKEFEDKNRGSFEQVKTQIATLSAMIADLSRMKADATENINVKEQEIIKTTAKLSSETTIYMKIWLENSAEMTIRRNDLAVFSFMLKLVKCKKAAAFPQLDRKKHGATLCETADGLELHFNDAKLQKEVESRMTASTRRAIREILGVMDADRAHEAADLLQRTRKSHGNSSDASDDDDDGDDDDDTSDDDEGGKEEKRQAALTLLGVPSEVSSFGGRTEEDPIKTATTTAGLPTGLAPKARVQKGVTEGGGRFKCRQGPVDCGLLHDNMSLMWGKFKDVVDELQAEMDKNEFEFKGLKQNFNTQLELIRATKAKYILELNEAIANLASAQEELSSQEEEFQELEKEYKKHMSLCKKKIEWIMFQDICAFISVRAKVMKFSTVSPPDKIVDCGVSAWIPGECSVPCDDTCPDKRDPYRCGGMQTLTRAIVVQSNEFGYSCPALSAKRKCNQIRCPVDCRLSRWSAWSKCTKDCEGGSRSRTRSVLVQAKNGGMACNVAAESQPCNTGSCDRNCKLKKWTQWSPCSVACGGGFSERWRKVTIPIRGNGKCPKAKSKIRFGLRKCNSHKCVGDEVCIAKQDLVIAIDGSGSLREEGFKILKGFVSSLVDKYKGQYYGFTDMQIGIVQFGNGQIMEDGTIADALDIQTLTNDMGKVKQAVEGLAFQKGFTNMAQAFTVAEKLLLLGGRKAAQSAVMTVTDGKPSFLFQTNEKVLQLKDKHTKLFFVPVTEFKGNDLKLMKKWASKPWPTNLVHVPGLDALKADETLFAAKCLVMFCPEALSPSSKKVEEQSAGFVLLREQGTCGERGALLSEKVAGAEECAALAVASNLSSFSLGTAYARGKCYGQKLAVSATAIGTFQANRVSPPCPAGEWVVDALYDFYVIEPPRAL